MKILFNIILLFSTIAYAEVTIHKRTSNFIDIEAKKDQIWVDCTDHPESGISLLGVHILDGDQSYVFLYRRSLGIKQCHEEEKIYRKMVNDGAGARLVGISPGEEKGPEPKVKEIPDRFTQVKKITSAFFVRLESKGKCKAYFSDHCELPKNYWGGVKPE